MERFARTAGALLLMVTLTGCCYRPGSYDPCTGLAYGGSVEICVPHPATPISWLWSWINPCSWCCADPCMYGSCGPYAPGGGCCDGYGYGPGYGYGGGCDDGCCDGGYGGPTPAYYGEHMPGGHGPNNYYDNSIPNELAPTPNRAAPPEPNAPVPNPEDEFGVEPQAMAVPQVMYQAPTRVMQARAPHSRYIPARY